MAFYYCFIVFICLFQVINCSHHYHHYEENNFNQYKGNDQPIVTTKLGKIVGSTNLKTRLNKTILSFRGIPYAKPPINHRRFKAPEAVEPWGDDVFNATDDGAACPQPVVVVDMKVSEDCLNLNVYTRKILKHNNQHLKPVMLFLHPGGFYGWTGNSLFLGPQYLLDEDIVLVTTNYRLGTLGFLSTGDDFAPGNNGLKDQVLAMKWVQEHIKQFGGDPNQVTLFGYSVGSFSTSLHLLSPMSKGLFHKAISMSGGMVIEPLRTNQMDVAVKQAKFLNCPYTSSEEIVECLKTKDAQEIASTFFSFQELGYDPVTIWQPVIEKLDGAEEPFLTEDCIKMYAEGNYQKVPYMMGTTTREFDFWANYVVRNETVLKVWNNDFNYAAPIGFHYERDTERSRNISQTLRKFYLNDLPIDNSTVRRFGDIYDDLIVGFSIDRLIHLVRKYNTEPVYYYKFNYKGRYSFYYEPNTNETIGPVHQDDLSYLFWIKFYQFPLLSSKDPEILLVKRMTKLWTNFAKYGNPTPKRESSTGNIIWEPYLVEKENYLKIDVNMSMESHFRAERYALINSLFPIPT